MFIKATSFPREYKAYHLDEKVFLEGDALRARGFSIAPDGLPSYEKEFFQAVIVWFSGQTDVNGEKLFEGDICQVDVQTPFGSAVQDMGVMKWIPNLCAFIIMIGSKHGNQECQISNVRKLGHELTHPDLIEKIMNNAKADH